MNIKKVGLTALAASLAATSAYAGELSISGGAKLSYVTKGGNMATTDVSSGFAMDNEITATGSAELDNGFIVSVTHGLAASGGSGSDSSTLTLNMGDLGTLSYDDTDGHGGLASLENKMPKAYEVANDGLGTTAVPVVMAKMPSGQGFGYSNTIAGATVSLGWSDGLGATTDRTDGGQDTTVASTNSSSSIAVSYDLADIGLSVFGGVGTEGQADGKELDHTTMGAVYAFGPVKIGYQINDEDDTDSSSTTTDLETEIYSIAFMVNDNLSISYGEHNSDEAGSAVDQEIESIQASYSMGGMTLNIKDSEVTGLSNVADQNHDTTEILLTFAF
jgi:outer membrane protein OmpU